MGSPHPPPHDIGGDPAARCLGLLRPRPGRLPPRPRLRRSRHSGEVHGPRLDRKNRGDGRGSGHVYVELLGDAGTPALWERQGARLYENYDPEATETPDQSNRVVYDKGGPDSVLLSHHGLEGEDETKRLFPKLR